MLLKSTAFLLKPVYYTATDDRKIADVENGVEWPGAMLEIPSLNKDDAFEFTLPLRGLYI